MKTFKIAMITAGAIISLQSLSLLVTYNLFSIDVYAAFIAVAFLMIGYFLMNPVNRKENSPINPFLGLTGRELSVFRLLGEGKTNKEIANIMTVEVSTIKTHTNNLYTKLGCRNRIDARNLWIKSDGKDKF